MNYQFKYYPEPGITYDIIRMLYVKLNANNIWKETLTTVDCQEEHIHFIEEHAKLLPEPDPDLALFAYIPTNRKTTFLSSIVDELISNNFSSFTLNSLYEYINNISRVKEGIFSYYFYDEFINSVDFEYQLRVNKTIPDRIKLLLFGFSYNPMAYIKKLNATIQEYSSLITKLGKVESFTIDALDQFVAIMYENNSKKHFKDSPDDPHVMMYSLCRCTPVFNLFFYSTQNPFFVSTPSTISKVLTSEDSCTNSELLKLIHSIDDQYRLDILRLIRLNEELSLLEISQKLNLSMTATKYHLAILKKANLIVCRRINRNAKYAYNPIGFKTLIKSLDNFEKGEL